RALALLRDAITADPKNPLFHMNSAAINVLKGDHKAAEEHYKKARELDPKSSLVRAALATVYLAQGQREKAEQELLDATRAEPGSEDLIRTLGNFYTQT